MEGNNLTGPPGGRASSRVRAFVPEPERASFDRYLRALRRSAHASGARSHQAKPYWMLMPVWLAGRRRRRTLAAEQKVLSDFLTAQYCLFLFVRIHDDVLDGQHRARPLVLTADRLAFHGRAIFARHFPPASRFWQWYDDALRQTVDAIAEVSHLQRTERVALPRLARAYARVNRVLLIASLAVCIRHRRSRDIRGVIQCADELAIGNQILDDAEDFWEDLRGGRRNYVARWVLRSPMLAGRDGASVSSLAAVLGQTAVAVRLFDDVRRRFRRALTLLRPLGLGEGDDHLRSYELSVVHMQNAMLRRGRRAAAAALRRRRRNG